METITIKYVSLRSIARREGLDKAYVRIIFKPSLKKSIVVAGFPGAGGVGVTAAKLLTELLEARLFAELYSPCLPDYTPVTPEGLCSLLKFNFFVSDERSLVVLVGEEQPPPDDIPAYYEICGDILDFIEGLDCNLIFTVDGIPVAYPRRKIYVSGTSRRTLLECLDRGAELYAGGRIVGLSGLILGLARLRGIGGVCILSPVTDLVSDREAALNAYGFLRRILGLGLEKTM